MKIIEMIQTNDGAIHKSQQEAKNHVKERIADVLDDFLNPMLSSHPWFKRTHLIDIVYYLTNDYEKVSMLINDLNIVFEEMED